MSPVPPLIERVDQKRLGIGSDHIEVDQGVLRKDGSLGKQKLTALYALLNELIDLETP